MKFIRDNFAYLFLALIAGLLIFITLSLQSIMLTQGGATAAPQDAGRGFIYTLRQQVADLILPATDTPTNPTPVLSTLDSQAALPTNTPLLVVAQTPSALPPAAVVLTATVAANATALPTTALPVVVDNGLLLRNAENLTISEDDNILATIIANDVNTVGFLGYSYYLANQDRLRFVALRLPDGQLVEPGPETLADGRYPLARPLLLYTAPATLRAKPQVEAFIGCYLNQLEARIGDVGYGLPTTNLFAQALQSFNAGCQRCQRMESASHLLATNLPACTLDGIPNAPILISGSSTLAPLTQRMVEHFTGLGFQGAIQVDSAGTGAGFRRFCTEGLDDIVDASRPITEAERASCVANGRPVLAFPVAVDALAVVVSRNNNFLREATLAQLGQIFTQARRWSDINAAWPGVPIARAIPGPQSGTFDFFVEAVLDGQAPVAGATPLALAPPPTVVPTAVPATAVPLVLPTALPPTPSVVDTPTSVPTAIAAVDTPVAADFRLAYLENNAQCQTATAMIQLVMERNFGLRVVSTGFTDAEELFAALAAKEVATRMDLTFCYVDPTHRAYLQRYFGFVIFIGSGYYQADSGKLIVMSNAAVKGPIERGNACFYRFLVNLDLNDAALTGLDPAVWYEQNRTLLESLTLCE